MILQEKMDAFQKGTGEQAISRFSPPMERSAYIIHCADDITEQIKAREREVKIEGIEKAFDLFNYAPMVVGLVNGDDHVLEMANDEAFKFWGKGTKIIGKPILEGIPELEGQGIIEVFDKVRTSGYPFIAHEVPIRSIVKWNMKNNHYFNLVYQPYNSNGAKATGVFTIWYNVTQQAGRGKRKESEEKYRTLFKSMTRAIAPWRFCLMVKNVLITGTSKPIPLLNAT